MPERQWQGQVVQLAKTCGWLVYHPWISVRSTAGFPDLLLARPPRLVMAELKREGRDPTDQQQAWLDALAACGVETHVWRPSDLDTVIETLR